MMIRFLFIIVSIFCGVQNLCAQLAAYYPNPGRGYMCTNKDIVKKVANIDLCSVSYYTANAFKYIYLNEIFTDECISKYGVLNEDVIYGNIKKYFDKFLNEKSKTRYILRVFPNNEGNSTRLSTLVDHPKAKSKKIHIWMPTTMYNIIQRSSYPVIVGKAIYPKYFTTYDQVAIMDYRNPLVQKVYDTVLRLFAQYLEEEIQAPCIMSDTNMSQYCKRGDLIYCIEMGFIGSWGEGITTDYVDYKDSKSLIQIAELYKKHLFRYLLIAPSYGMRTNTTKNPAIYDFQYYLLTTTYGSKNKNKDGLYYGSKEFGLFMDHLGSSDYLYDFDLDYLGKPLKDIAKVKHIKAPFIGENNGQFNIGKDLILQNISDYGVSLAHLWTAIPLDSITQQAEYIWQEAANQLGYAFYLDIAKHTIGIKNGKLKVCFTIYNKGTSKVYSDIWLPQLVIRNQEDEIQKIIDIDNELDLCTIPSVLNKTAINHRIIEVSRVLSRQLDGMKIYLRFVDKKHINDNMYLINQKRTDKGEYLLGF